MSFLDNKYIAINIGGIEIDLSRSSGGTPVRILSVVRGSKTNPLTLDKTTLSKITSDPIINGLLPNGLSLTINDVMLADCNGAKVLAASFGAKLNLSDLPVVGSSLPKGTTFGIDNLQLIFSTAALSPNEMQAINGQIPTGIAPLPSLLQKGLNFAVALALGDEKQSLSSVPRNAIGVSGTPKTTIPPAAPTESDQVGITIDKTIGPIHITEIGLALTPDTTGSSSPSLVISASIKFGPLDLGLIDLEVGPPALIKDVPTISLGGLSLDYQSKTTTIGGELLELDGEYTGGVTLALSKLQISALGSFTKDAGDPSLFIYGLLDEPLGGPAFCFVEGLAVGFGYNRNFIAPPVTGISTFPLIEAASGKPAQPPTAQEAQDGVGTMLQKLNEYIVPSIGEQFIGIGLKFTTFKVINSFALLVAKFGNELEFDLLGESTYIAPNPNDPNQVAVVELELVGSYKPSDETLMIRGQLTPGSFVITQACHLEGGFAIGNWFKTGDFVYTFGGYASGFNVPSHYPQNIPKLGFLWQVDSEVSIKGGGYWATTPSEVMLGGYLQAVYTSDWVHASFEIDAAFEADWSPFHYAASFSVTFSLHVRIDLLFCSEWLGFEVSKGLQIWGPSFGGEVSMDLAVATVHIDFGEEAKPEPLLSGADFAKNHLPKKDSIVSINIEKGLVKKVGEGTAATYIVNPKELQITTDSIVPSTSISAPGLNPPPSDSFEIVPMGVTYAGTASTHTISITGDGKDSFVVESKLKNATASMWLKTPKTADNDLIFGSTITAKAPSTGTGIGPIDQGELAKEPFTGKSTTWEASESSSVFTKKEADTLTVAAIDQTLFGQLNSAFSFNDETASDTTGLQGRLTNMNDTEILVGTLNHTL